MYNNCVKPYKNLIEKEHVIHSEFFRTHWNTSTFYILTSLICVPSSMKPQNQKGYVSPSAFEYNPTHLVIQSSLNVRTYQKVTKAKKSSATIKERRKMWKILLISIRLQMKRIQSGVENLYTFFFSFVLLWYQLVKSKPTYWIAFKRKRIEKKTFLCQFHFPR